jgi:uncharacterized protein YggE
MKPLSVFLAMSSVLVCKALAQVGGGSVYNGQNLPPHASELAKRTVSKDDAPPTPGGMFVDAAVLMNVRADEYVAVFGISQEGTTLDEARSKIDGTISKFLADLKGLGVAPTDTYVDFVAQNRIYGYDVQGDVAQEKVAGFEVKKNVSVHYKSEPFLAKALEAASKSQIFDLIKVDYIVRDVDAIHAKLMESAAAIIKQKSAAHAKLFGLHLGSPQIWAEKYSAYYPTDMYSSYTAFEGEDVSGQIYRQKYTVQSARKNRTFYFDPLTGADFDRVISPIVTEPVVQFTLYLKVKYEKAPAPAKKPARKR